MKQINWKLNLRPLLVSALLVCISWIPTPPSTFAQSVSPDDYVRDTLPSQRPQQEQGVQSIAEIASLPSTSSRPDQTGFQARYSGSAHAHSAFQPAYQTARPTDPVAHTARFQSTTSSASYAYPTQSPPRTNPLLPMGAAGGRTVVTTSSTLPARRQTTTPVPGFVTHTGTQFPSAAANQSATPATNTLGFKPIRPTQYRVAQNCNCNSNPNIGNVGNAYQAPAFQAPAINVPTGQNYQPTNVQPQSNQYQQPYAGQPNYQLAPNLGSPQFGNQGASWWTPFVSGSGSYTPLLKLQNMPPGSYLGQGLIGQPTAYVDGQPFRNLMRYVFP